MDRRDFLKGTLLAPASLGAASHVFSAAPEGAAAPVRRSAASAADAFIDTNVYLGQWPFRRMDGDETDELVSMLRRHGVQQAWAGSFDGLFHKDMAAVNARLAEACRDQGEGLLVPMGSVNPMLPAWREDIRRIAEEHHMPGIRLHPGYHNYALDDEVFAEVLRAAADRNLLVQVVPWMQDERHHNVLMPVPTPSLVPLAEHARALPALRIVVLNGFRTALSDEFRRLADAENVLFDFAKLDVIDGLSEYLAYVPAERIVFGSYAPMFHFESAALKMQESLLTPEQAEAIRLGNARRLLAHA